MDNKDNIIFFIKLFKAFNIIDLDIPENKPTDLPFGMITKKEFPIKKLINIFWNGNRCWWIASTYLLYYWDDFRNFILNKEYNKLLNNKLNEYYEFMEKNKNNNIIDLFKKSIQNLQTEIFKQIYQKFYLIYKYINTFRDNNNNIKEINEINIDNIYKLIYNKNKDKEKFKNVYENILKNDIIASTDACSIFYYIKCYLYDDREDMSQNVYDFMKKKMDILLNNDEKQFLNNELDNLNITRIHQFKNLDKIEVIIDYIDYNTYLNNIDNFKKIFDNFYNLFNKFYNYNDKTFYLYKDKNNMPNNIDKNNIIKQDEDIINNLYNLKFDDINAMNVINILYNLYDKNNMSTPYITPLISILNKYNILPEHMKNMNNLICTYNNKKYYIYIVDTDGHYLNLLVPYFNNEHKNYINKTKCPSLPNSYDYNIIKNNFKSIIFINNLNKPEDPNYDYSNNIHIIRQYTIATHCR